MRHNGLFYQIKGKGYPVIFLPGIGATHRMFAPQVKCLSRYFQTITLDLRGTGQSLPFTVYNPWNYLEKHAESIIDLMNYLNIEDAILVGVSYGGMAAQTVATHHPERVSKLILIDSYARTIPHNLNEFLLVLFALGVTLSNLVPSKWLKPFVKFYAKWELAYSEMLAVLEERRAGVVMMQLIGAIGMDNLKRIGKLDIPILGIVGDTVPMVVKMTEEIIEAAPDGQLVVVEDAFDPSNLCNPSEVNETLLSFMHDYAMMESQSLS